MSSSGGGTVDGDKGDILVSGAGGAMAFDPAVVSAFARTLLDDVNLAAAQATLGIGGENTLVAIAGDALGGQVAVYLAGDGKAYKADKTSALSRLVVGVTTGAAVLGAPATIQIGGIMTEGSWSWLGTEVVWLGVSGLLTQTIPSTDYLVQVGVPAGPTKLRIEPQLIAKV